MASETANTNAVAQTLEKVHNAAPPLPADSTFSWSGYFTAIGTLFILLAVLWALVWVLRRSGKFNFIPRPGSFPRDGMRIEAQLPLGPRKGLTVVRFLDKRLLLGITDHNITLLQEINIKGDAKTLDFQSLLEKEEHTSAAQHNVQHEPYTTSSTEQKSTQEECNENSPEGPHDEHQEKLPPRTDQ